MYIPIIRINRIQQLNPFYPSYIQGLLDFLSGKNRGRSDKKILGFIGEKGYISDRDYVKLTNRAKATRSFDFKKLMDMGLIERKGKGRTTYYKLKEKP